MFLKFAKLNPCENMTILVQDPVPREHQCAVAEELMAYGSVYGEQVGFIEEATIPGARARLQMMGGEFCGNATMCLASLLAMQEDLPINWTQLYPLEVSGADGLVECRVQHFRQRYSCSVRMPLPTQIREMEFANGVRRPVVFFPGIAHAIVPAETLTPAEAENCIAAWCESCGTEAFGIMLVSESDLFDCAMRPLVYVKGTNSSVWERGCGSGTAAMGAYRAWQDGSAARIDIEQPGGYIASEAECSGGRITKLEISGTVYPACSGEAWVDMHW